MYLVLLVQHFIEGQGYAVTNNIIHQENQSTMLLEKNGTQSSTKNTQHIEIQYFFIADNVGRNKVLMNIVPLIS